MHVTTRTIAVAAALAVASAAVAEPTPGLEEGLAKLQAGELPAAAKPLTEAARAGDPVGRYLLARLYSGGYVTGQQDFDSARALHKLAADQNVPEAAFSYGMMLLMGRGGEKDLPGGVAWLRRGGLLGHREAAFNAGVAYYNGDGVEKDPAAAWAWLSFAESLDHPKAAAVKARAAAKLDEQGLAAAKQQLAEIRAASGKAIDEGVVRVAVSMEAAQQAMYEKAERAYMDERWGEALAGFVPLLQSGHGPSHFYVARMLEKGRGVDQNLTEAARIYTVAIAKHGNAASLWNLGILYLNGQGVPKDERVAADLFEAAAWRGQAGPMGYAGDFYYRGEGREKDLAAAYAWWKLAADRGNEAAKRMLDKLVGEADAATVERGKATAAEIEEAAKAGRIPPLPRLTWPPRQPGGDDAGGGEAGGGDPGGDKADAGDDAAGDEPNTTDDADDPGPEPRAIEWKEYEDDFEAFTFSAPADWKRTRIAGMTLVLQQPGKPRTTISTMRTAAGFQSFNDYVANFMDLQQTIAQEWKEKGRRNTVIDGHKAVQIDVLATTEMTLRAQYNFINAGSHFILLGFAAPVEQWDDLEPVWEKAVASFDLE